MNYYIQVLKKYATFSGRARRKEYWMFILVNLIVGVILSFVDGAMGSAEEGSGLLSSIYSLAVFIPSLAVAVRRMHDVNKSGWFIIVPIYNLVLACTAGTKGDNRFGPDPIAAEATAVKAS
ncbi:MAG TPA: DUF805 domain-containing protein [Patescibacteria group bacterium]|nr:DUF805 domain-containing protein [Patescibacteria group bacterium]